MTIRSFISLSLFMLLLISVPVAQATPSLMATYGAPGCGSCHSNPAGPAAGLAAYLASKTPTCTAPQVLQNNVCVTPTITCTAPQVLQNNVCVTPPPVCTAPLVLQNNVCVCPNPQVLQNNACVTPPPANTMVRMQTSLGIIDIRLFDTDAPLTVANFLSYVDSGAYSNLFIQRSVPGFVVQGGGYFWNKKTNSIKPLATKPPVVSEFNPNHSNLRGAIAMATVSGNPNSATSQWLVNLVDNSANLDHLNGGATVFGQVMDKSMAVVDAIAALPVKNAGGALSQVPINTSLTGTKLASLLKKPLAQANLVSFTGMTSNHASSTISDSDRVFAYLEAAYPSYFVPANPLWPSNSGSATNINGVYFRYYPTTKSFVASYNGTVYYGGPVSNNQTIAWGTVLDWLAVAIQAGY